MRLDRSTDVMKVLFLHHERGHKIDIYIRLKYRGEEFCKRWIPFESIPRLDMKFRVRCSREDFTECLSNLSSEIQVLVAEEAQNSKLVLESEEMFYVSLQHTMATLSICKVTDVSKDPKCVHHVNCLVFLDRSPCKSGSKPTADLCPECTKGSYLMTVFHEVKHSSGTIDICDPQVKVTTMVTDEPELKSLQGGSDKHVEPTDLSFKSMVTSTTEPTIEMVETERVDPPSMLDPETTQVVSIVTEKLSRYVGIQASVNETPLKADVAWNKMSTTKPIKRKHRGFPLEKFLTQKVERMRQRLQGLQKDLIEKEQRKSSSRYELLTEAQVPSSESFDLQSPRVTVVLLRDDGPPAIVPSVLPWASQNETLLPLTSGAGRKDTEKPFKCPVEGCNYSFSCKSSVSRHKRRIHFPDKLHQCSHCDHVFPRPYMLQRHLDQRVCLNASKHGNYERQYLGP